MRSLVNEVKKHTEELLAHIEEGIPLKKSFPPRGDQVLSPLKAILYFDERERKHVTAGLRDEVSQTLASIKMLSENAAILVNSEQSELLELLEQISAASLFALSEVEHIIDEVRPSILDVLGITSALSWTLRKFREANPSIHIVEHLKVDDADIPDQLKTDVFRVFQALINNVAQHSQARRMEVVLAIECGFLELQVEDNGSGFDKKRTRADASDTQHAHAGDSMLVTQARMRLRGGRLKVFARDREGTCVAAFWPLAA
ncbi:MAG: hypothetical protein HY788_02040 [Deltaproteobacteria bacterium]|nr:hypothetical protein [Deltaproteobacteria bacterium]